MMDKNPLSLISEEQVRQSVMDKIKGSYFESSFKENPKLLDGTVEWLRDDTAIPKLFSIIKAGERSKKYAFCVLGLFIFSFIFPIFYKKKSFLKRVGYRLGYMLFSITLSMVVFYQLFEPELSPTISIFKKYLS